MYREKLNELFDQPNTSMTGYKMMSGVDIRIKHRWSRILILILDSIEVKTEDEKSHAIYR